MLAESASGENPLPDTHIAVFLLCLQMVEGPENTLSYKGASPNHEGSTLLD